MKGIWLVLLLALVGVSAPLQGAETWPGVDQTVVNRIAREQGRTARQPLINLEGDLQLFAFLSAGVVGGFAAGYYWRMLMEGGRKKDGEHERP